MNRKPVVLEDSMRRVMAAFHPDFKDPTPPASLDTIAELLAVLVAEVRALRRNREP